MTNSEEKSLILRKYVAGTVYDLQNLALRQITCTSPKLFEEEYLKNTPIRGDNIWIKKEWKVYR